MVSCWQCGVSMDSHKGVKLVLACLWKEGVRDRVVLR